MEKDFLRLVKNAPAFALQGGATRRQADAKSPKYKSKVSRTED
jgi:hypothetical protein